MARSEWRMFFGQNKPLAVSLGIAALSLAACSPQPCDRVEPLFAAPRFALVRREPPIISLYEHLDDVRGQPRITGKSISFVATQDFRSNWSEDNGGPQYAAAFQYRVVGHSSRGQPVFARTGVEKPGGFGLADNIRVQLYAQALTPPRLDPSHVLEAKGLLPLEVSRTVGHSEPDLCGFKVTSFEPPVYDQKHLQSSAITRQWPYGARSILLGRLDNRGSYRPYIGCTGFIIARTGAPVCAIYSDYHGWLLQISFADGHVCDADQRIADARTFYDEHLVSETPRAQGFREYRWPTGPQPERDHNCPRPGSFPAWLQGILSKE